ncbi:thioredoxin domain-containing protein [Pseudonocardia sp. KRD291]|uniref:DsbA family protein n=1 Tax=Pseudonocardia sp. KRD291 TaxID=2792007 RepID=UPI001C4A4BA4|nr:thioredoxin domain-containing protein [Pseudonocardia sp. KRD291]
MKLSLIVGTVFVLVVAAMFAATRLSGDAPERGSAEAAAVAARPDSHRLSAAPGSTVDFVEFLDFECEACGAAYPAIEQLRQQYGDRVNFVVRYFPVPSHFNAERAARAVEAAAQQGRFEAMYKMMYETQREWGEQQVPMDDRFRGYAQRLGLDLARFDAAYNAPATLDRVRADREDGLALGVQGTPTFFVNGQKLEPQSFGDLTRALDDALAGS